jgi:hypothetical protein
MFTLSLCFSSFLTGNASHKRLPMQSWLDISYILINLTTITSNFKNYTTHLKTGLSTYQVPHPNPTALGKISMQAQTLLEEG